MFVRLQNFALILLTATTLTVACGKKKSSNNSQANPEEDTSNPSSAYPSGLALSVMPTTASTTLRLAEDAGLDRPPAEKNAETEKLLSGEADSCLPKIHAKDLPPPAEELCYEFDQDLIYGGSSQPGNSTITTYKGTKDGKNSSGEACFAAFTRTQVRDVTAMVDQTLGFVAAGICQFKKDNADGKLPDAAGESIDLAASLKTVFGTKIGEISKAEIKRLDDVSGRPVFLTKIDLKDRNGLTRGMRLVHSPDVEAGSKNYNGTIALAMDGDVRDTGPKMGANDKHRLLSVNYARTSDTAIKFELRTAQIHKDLVSSAFDSTYTLDFNVGAKFTETAGTQDYGKYYKASGAAFAQANEAVDGMTYVAFDMNKDTGEGTLSYWRNPGGNYYENARGFNVAVAKNASGALAGCATSGAASIDFTTGTSIRRYLKEGGSLSLQAKGFMHPFFNSTQSGFAGPTADGTDSFYTWTKSSPTQEAKWYTPRIASTSLADKFVKDQSGSLISRQCFKQNTSSGVYEIDTASTTESAGFELLDSGVAANSAKFIAPPSVGEAKPLAVDAKKAAE